MNLARAEFKTGSSIHAGGCCLDSHSLRLYVDVWKCAALEGRLPHHKRVSEYLSIDALTMSLACFIG